MKQANFTDIEYQARKRVTKREKFLQTMDSIIPWKEWAAYIEPHYPSGKRGRPPMGIEKMLRMYLLQNWFNLSDEGLEDAIYDSYAMRSFLQINFMVEQVPDATTLLKFRHLLEKHNINQIFFTAIASFLDQHGFMMRGGTIVDATIINAPSSTKNVEKQRDPEMHSTKKGNQYHFGMKVSIGVDAGSGYVHSIETTSANVHDISVASKLLRDDDNVVYGDSGYLGLEKREEIRTDEKFSKIDYRINRRKGSIRKGSKFSQDWEKYIERQKSSVRSKVEHPFLIVKKLFGYSKVAYKGLKKNTHRFYLLFASANLLMLARSGRLRIIA